MGAFKNPNFVAEFSYRTQWNYFMLRSLQETDPEKTAYINKKIQKLEEKMRSTGYEIADFFEVTQLINSLIGLLVFPEQAGYEYISNTPTDLKDMLPLLYEYIENKPGRYTNTYREVIRSVPFSQSPDEYNSPRNILRHLRNAASHKEMGILPVNGEIVKGRQRIQEIVFKDKKARDRIEQHFELIIAVEDLEPLLLEIGDVLLKLVH